MFDSNTDFRTSIEGTRWINNSFVNIAYSVKNIFFILAFLYLLIIVITLLFSTKTDEEVNNFKKWIIWISIWVIITQIWFSFIDTLFDEQIDDKLAIDFVSNIINPLISLLKTITSFVFLAVMFYWAFRLLTANWDEEKAKTWKMSIIYSLVWFIVIKLTHTLVTTIYGKTYCTSHICTDRKSNVDLKWFSAIVEKIIEWMNSFVWVIVILLIIYAWFLMLTSFWDEEKVKKAKNIIIYIIAWIIVLFANYIILTFLILPETI
jgi:hypothetical protein